jgi:acetyl-CoA synthetase
MPDTTLSGEVFYPSADVLRHAHVPDWQKLSADAAQDLEGFWANEASELHWFDHWGKVLDDSDKPFFKWFTGEDQHRVQLSRPAHTDGAKKQVGADVGREKGEFRSFSYFALRRETCRFANVLRSLGVQKGDRVTLYMGRIPELMIGMLACARIGAIHSVVYGGFTVEALHERLEDSQSKVLIVADGAYQRGKIVPLKSIADEALQRAATVESVRWSNGQAKRSTWNRAATWYHELMALPIAGNQCHIEIMDAEDRCSSSTRRGPRANPKRFFTRTAGTWLGRTPR